MMVMVMALVFSGEDSNVLVGFGGTHAKKKISSVKQEELNFLTDIAEGWKDGE